MSDYGDWVISQMLKQYSTQDNKSHTQVAIDILSRWLIIVYNKKYRISSPDKPYDGLISEYKKRGIEPPLKAIKFLTRPLHYEYPYTFVNNTFTCHNYSITLPRMKKLLEFGKKETASMLLQYATIMIGESNFWSIPHDKYIEMQKKYKATVEGFASPLNSQFLLIDLPYCSVLPIDKKFNSRGSFFEQDFKKDTVICNPPFDNDFMLDVANFIDKSPGKFIVVVPTRPDVPFYEKLKKMGSELIWKKYTYDYEHNNNLIPASFDTSVFEIDNSS